MRSLLPAFCVLAACSEYNLKHDPNTTDAPGDTDGTTTATPTSDLSCEDQVFPGYAGSADACPANDTPFEPVLEWSYDTWSVAPESKSVMMTPLVVPLDDSGLPSVVVVTYVETAFDGTGILRAVKGDGSAEVFNNVDAGLQSCSGLAAGDLDGDGTVEIVGVTVGGEARAFDHAGNVLWTSVPLGLDIGNAYNVVAPNPAIADMDGDGSPEIVIGRAIVSADGTLVGEGDAGTASGMNYGESSFPVDIDRDGTEEVVTGNALYRPDGSTIWSNGDPDGHVAVGNFDDDPAGEIVVVINSSVRLEDDDGTVLWTTPIPNARFIDFGGPPTIADFDGDGRPEIGVAANSTYTVLNDDGSVLWQANTTDGSSGVTGSSVFDFDGDGVAEVVYADEEHLWVFSGPDGAVRLESDQHSSWTVLEYPVIADVDADGHAEIVVARNINPAQTRPQSYGIAVFGDALDQWLPGRQIWNQYAYHITNVNDDGSIPRVAAVNWDSYNSFRSGDLVAGQTGTGADPTVAEADLCTLDCDEDTLHLWVNPGDLGSADLATATVGLWKVVDGYESLVSEQPVTNLVHGNYADSLQFDVSGDVASIDTLIVRIQSDAPECDPGNDEVRWSGPFCP